MSTNARLERKGWEAMFLDPRIGTHSGTGTKKKGWSCKNRTVEKTHPLPETLHRAEVGANAWASLFLTPSVSHRGPNLAGIQLTRELENGAFAS